CMQSIKEPFTF
nr:immunoglobulin light chain junction region [Macaca mulatta]